MGLRKLARRIGALAGLAILALGVGTFIPRPLWPPVADLAIKPNRVLIFHNTIHTDIAIPLDDETRARFAFLKRSGIAVDLPEAHYALFGWGGRSFYLETPTWQDLKPLPLLKAFSVDTSVMHVDLAGEVSETQANVVGISLSDAQFMALVDFIDRSFTRNASGVIRISDVAYNDFDGFFVSDGLFNAFVGCNTWTASALRAAGLRTGFWNPLPLSLDLSMRLYN